MKRDIRDLVFNLPCDGKTDCTDEFQRQLDEGRIVLPAGEYAFSRPIVVSAGLPIAAEADHMELERPDGRGR